MATFDFSSIAPVSDKVTLAQVTQDALDAAEAVLAGRESEKINGSTLGSKLAVILVTIFPQRAQFQADRAADRAAGKIRGLGLKQAMADAFGVPVSVLPAASLKLASNRAAQARWSQIKRDYEDLPKVVPTLGESIIAMLGKAEPVAVSEALSALTSSKLFQNWANAMTDHADAVVEVGADS